jgi:hypothetical protein
MLVVRGPRTPTGKSSLDLIIKVANWEGNKSEVHKKVTIKKNHEVPFNTVFVVRNLHPIIVCLQIRSLMLCNG